MELQTDTKKLADIDPEKAKRFAQRLHRKKDDIALVRKATEIDQIIDGGDERSIVARVSTPDRDRDGEIVEPKGIDLTYYNANPVLMWAHEYKLPPIGRAMWTRADDNGLLCKFQFAETAFADEIYTLYRDGFLKTFSIGFIPVEFDGKTKTHQRTSLLEVSAVPIPSNPGATVEAEAKGLIKCAQLRKDLGVPEKDTIVTEKGAAVAPELGEKLDEKLGDKLGEVKAEVETPEIPETKEAAPVDAPAPDVVPEGDAGKLAVTISLTDDLKAALTALNARLDGIEARLAPPPVTPPVATPPNAPLPVINPEDVDIIDIEDAPDILDIEDAAPVAAPAPKSAALPAPASAPAITEADVLAAIERMDLKSIVKQYVDLALDKLRGRVR